MPVFYVFLLLLTSFLWGGNFVYSKFLIGHASPITLTLLRWIIAIICLLPLILKKEKTWFPQKAAIIPLILMGLTGVVFFNIFQFLALAKTSSVNTGLISTLNPISIALASALLLHEKIAIQQCLAMILSLIGVLIVISKGEVAHLLALNYNAGDLWMIAAVMVWGIYSVCGNWAIRYVSPMMATFYSGVFGVVILLPFTLSSFHISHPNLTFLASLLYTGIISTVVCMILWNIGVQKIGATHSGVFLNFNPIFTAVLAYFLLGEAMTRTEIYGSLIVITGCYLFSRYSPDRVPKNTGKHK